MHRFFITNNQENPTKEIVLSDDLFHQATRVLRLNPNEDVEIIYDGMIMIGNFNGDKIIIKEYKLLKSKTGPKTILVQGIPKNQKMSLILQKSTELNVDQIILWNADRSISKLSDFESKQLRFEKIVLEASEQTRRNEIPKISYVDNLNELGVKSNDLVLMLYENEDKENIRSYLSSLESFDNIYLIIGPEGGITPAEVSLANEKGWNIVTTGNNILRTETAAIFALSAIELNKKMT